MNNEFFYSDGDSDTKTIPGEIVSLARIIHLLKETSLRLKLDVAILSRIVDDTYYVIGSHTPFGTINPGTSFPLRGTYAEIISREHKMVTYLHEGEGVNIGMHPVYQTSHLQTFIGIPVVNEEGLLGSLSFSSEHLKKSDFSPYDIAMVRDLARNPEVVQMLENVEFGE